MVIRCHTCVEGYVHPTRLGGGYLRPPSPQKLLIEGTRTPATRKTLSSTLPSLFHVMPTEKQKYIFLRQV
jgi:hypothetical protein